MKIKNLTKEELETMSYDDIAACILEETNRQMKINELFKEVCNLLELTEEEFVEKLPAFFECLSTNQRFIMLENGLWDLKTKHAVKVVMDTEEDEETDLEEIIDEEETENEEEDIYNDNADNDLDDDDDDLKDLVIIDEEDEANGIS